MIAPYHNFQTLPLAITFYRWLHTFFFWFKPNWFWLLNVENCCKGKHTFYVLISFLWENLHLVLDQGKDACLHLLEDRTFFVTVLFSFLQLNIFIYLYVGHIIISSVLIKDIFFTARTLFMYPNKGHCLDNNKCTLLNASNYPHMQTLDV